MGWSRLFGVGAIIVILWFDAFAATNCEQTFQVFGKTSGENSVLYFQVSLRGDCLKDRVYALHFVGNSTKRFTYDQQDSDWIAGFLKSESEEPFVKLQDSSGSFRIDSSRLVLPPPTDASFPDRYAKLADTTPGKAGDWRKTCRKGCFDPPRFTNGKATLVYSHETGIYKNYTITQALWFPKSQLLVLITHQPLRTKEGNGNHGMLVWRVGDRDTLGAVRD